MTKRDDIKKKIKDEEKRSSGEGQLGSGSTEESTDVDEAMKEMMGHEPNGGTLADEFQASSDDQTSKLPHEEKETENEE